MSRLPRKNAVSIAEALQEMFRASNAGATFNTRRIFTAWDQASGASDYTIRRYFRDGVLYITMKSSVMATQLSMQKDALLEKINSILAEDPLFNKLDSCAGTVRELRIR